MEKAGWCVVGAQNDRCQPEDTLQMKGTTTYCFQTLGPWTLKPFNYQLQSLVVLHGVMGFPINDVTGGYKLSYFTPRTGLISPLGAHFEAMTAKKKHLLLAILLVPFLGCLSDPFNGCWWPPTIGDKKVTLNHLVLVMSSIMALCFCSDLFSCGCSSQWFRD